MLKRSGSRRYRVGKLDTLRWLICSNVLVWCKGETVYEIEVLIRICEPMYNFELASVARFIVSKLYCRLRIRINDPKSRSYTNVVKQMLQSYEDTSRNRW